MFQENKPRITEIVQSKIPLATVVSQTSTDVLKFCLPFSEQPKFPELFQELEKIEGLQVNFTIISSTYDHAFFPLKS